MSSSTIPATYSNTVRIGYARVSARTQDHQLQLDALAAAVACLGDSGHRIQ